MPLSKEERINVILESFEILVENLELNLGRCADTIAKMSKYDTNITEQMWVTLLEKSKNLIECDDYSYKLSGGIIYGIKEQVSEDLAYKIISNNDFIQKMIFGKSKDIYHYIVSDTIKKEELILANQYLQLISENKNKENSFDWYFEEILDYCTDEEITEEQAEFLMEWSNKIKDKNIKAKARVCLIDYL